LFSKEESLVVLWPPRGFLLSSYHKSTVISDQSATLPSLLFHPNTSSNELCDHPPIGVIKVIGFIGVIGCIGVIGVMGFIGVIGRIGGITEETLLLLHAIGRPL
jgi:hypothetical protein